MGVVPAHTSPQCWYIPKNKQNYKAEIKLLCEDFYNDLEEIAGRIHDNIIKPFCDTHNLEFTSTMGMWFFSGLKILVISDDWNDYIDKNWEQYGEKYARFAPPEGYQKIRELLNESVLDTQLFEYLTDYTKG